MTPRPPRPVGLTIYSCDPDEAQAFQRFAPRFGVVPTMTRAPVSAASTVALPRNRCVSVGHKSAVTAPVLAGLLRQGVEHLSTRSIGVDHIDLQAAERLGMVVENVVYEPDGVADFSVMLMLMAIRGAKPIVSAAQRHDFRLSRVRGRELRDLTVGVVGVGNIGTAVITRLQGFGGRVLACTNGRARTDAAELVPFEQLLAESDVVTLHVPLNPETRHCIGRAELAAMRPGAFLVNTGRGALVDTAALLDSLEDGQLGGAALDVLEGEEGLFSFDCTGRPIDHAQLLRLLAMPNVLITPHTAFHTARVLTDTVETTLRLCVDFMKERACA